jgi:hypothetical protein
MTSAGVDRELLAVLVALEPLDDRKWDYLDLRERIFHSDLMLQESWSSGERVLIDVATSLWNTGTVDLGYITCALGGRHLQAVIDATAIRAGHDLTSNVSRAMARISSANRSGIDQKDRTQEQRPPFDLGPVTPIQDQPSRGLKR